MKITENQKPPPCPKSFFGDKTHQWFLVDKDKFDPDQYCEYQCRTCGLRIQMIPKLTEEERTSIRMATTEGF